MNEILSAFLMLVGSAFILIAAIGVLKMPDILIRMHSSTKAGTVGVGLTLLSVAAHFVHSDITTRVFAAMIFLFLTAPVATHLIARAAYFVRTPLWEKTFVDELRDSEDSQYYDGDPP